MFTYTSLPPSSLSLTTLHCHLEDGQQAGACFLQTHDGAIILSPLPSLVPAPLSTPSAGAWGADRLDTGLMEFSLPTADAVQA